MDYRQGRALIREWLGGETPKIVAYHSGLTMEQFGRLAARVQQTEPEMYARAAANGLRRERRMLGICPECGGDARDGNCSPIYDDEGLCVDCGEQRYEQAMGWTEGR